MSRKSKRPAAQKRWQPLRRYEFNPDVLAKLAATGDPPAEVWGNDQYQVLVRYEQDGMVRLGIHRDDRRPIRDWRHLQAIKNEVCGTDRWAVEVFPAEASLVDTSNEFWLYVYPEGERPPFAFAGDWAVGSHGAANEGRVAGENKARQRPWQPGLPTGLGLLDVLTDPVARELVQRARQETDAALRRHRTS